jgi:hypothetical protein
MQVGMIQLGSVLPEKPIFVNPVPQSITSAGLSMER